MGSFATGSTGEREGTRDMTKIVCLISLIGLAACASTPPSPQSRPTTEEKLSRELERAQDRAIHDVIWTLQNVGRRALRDAISGR